MADFMVVGSWRLEPSHEADGGDAHRWDFAELRYALVQMNHLWLYRVCDALALINLIYEWSPTGKNTVLSIKEYFDSH